MANEKKQSIEENFKEIEEIITGMQKDDITLDQTFDLYNQGLKLVQDCNRQIDKIEKKIKVIEEGKTDE